MHARIFYTAEVLGKLDEMHEEIFKEIHVDKKTLTTEVDIEEFFVRFDVSPEEFKSTFRSFPVETKLNRAKNLTQRYVTVSNYPGTTVEVVRARVELNGSACEVLDTPGVNDLSQPGDEARVTREILEQTPEATVVQVADAKNLRRALLLSLQLAELKRPAVLVLNMMDELRRRGGRVDTARLAETLGVPVPVLVPSTVAW